MVILVVNFNFINISSNGILFMLMVTGAEITPDKYQNNEQNDNQMSVYTSDSAPISYLRKLTITLKICPTHVTKDYFLRNMDI